MKNKRINRQRIAVTGDGEDLHTASAMKSQESAGYCDDSYTSFMYAVFVLWADGPMYVCGHRGL